MRVIVAMSVAWLAFASLAGCGMPYTAEELAEKSLVSSFESVNAFLRVEHANREMVKREMPDVHQFAEDARREYPPLHRLTTAALELYRSAGTSQAKDELAARQLALERWSATARAFVAAINDRKPRVAPLPGVETTSNSEGSSHVDSR